MMESLRRLGIGGKMRDSKCPYGYDWGTDFDIHTECVTTCPDETYGQCGNECDRMIRESAGDEASEQSDKHSDNA